MHHKGQRLIWSCFPASVIDRINQGIMLDAGFTPFQRIVNYMIHVVTLPVRHCVCTVIAQMFSITWFYSEELLDDFDSFPALLSELMQPGVDHILHKGVARPNCTNVSIRSREPVPLLKNAQ